MTVLSRPCAELYDAWADCVRDFGDGSRDGSGDWRVPGLGPDRASFAALLDVVAEESDPASVLPEGRVHSDYLWITQDEVMVGFLAVRHSIDTDFLRTRGGHIGYSVRPSHRRRGHASRALALGLERARALGLAHVLLTCDEDNTASARTIRGRGGVPDGSVEGKLRFWITL